MKKLLNKEMIIGGCVIITLAILFFGIDYLKGINIFKAANYYYVSYTNVAGLAQSSPVTVNGFKVGLVREISYEYDNPGHILVELSLDKQLKVPRGTQAVLTQDMLGTASIELKMVPGADYHEIGDKIEGVNATGLMDNLSQEMLPKVVNILPKVDSLLTAATLLVSDPALTSSVRRLDNIMANLESSTASLAIAMKSIQPAVKGAPAIMANVDEITCNLQKVSEDLTAVSAQLKTIPLDSTMQNVLNVTSNLNDITAKLNSTNSSLGMLLNDPALYNNLNNSAADLDSILIDLKRQPKRYIPSIKIF